MRVIRFDKMSVSVPIKNDETVEEIEDKMIEAVSSIDDGIVMTYRIVIEDEPD